MIKRILRQPVLMTWLSYFVQIGAGIFVLPLILLEFTTEEVAVWLVFSIVMGVAMLADAGFGPSIVRATAYYYSGARKLPKTIGDFNRIEQKSAAPNYRQLENLLITTEKIYLALSLMACMVILCIGFLISRNVIFLAGDGGGLWIAFGGLVISCGIKIQMVRYSSFIQGINEVALVRGVESLFGTFRILLYVCLLLLGYKILALVLADLFINILFLAYMRLYANAWMNRHISAEGSGKKFDKELFASIWPASWRMGSIMIGSYLINYGSALLVAQVNDAVLIANYLLTLRLLFLVRQFAQAPLYANLPRIMQSMANHEFNQVKEYVSRGIFYGGALLVGALIVLGAFGNILFEYLNMSARIVPLDIFLLLSIWILLEFHHALHAQVYMASNHVPFLLPALLSGTAILVIGYLIMPFYGLLGLVVTQIIVQASCNNWYPVKLSLRLLNWPFKSYIKEMPLVGLRSVKKIVTSW